MNRRGQTFWFQLGLALFLILLVGVAYLGMKSDFRPSLSVFGEEGYVSYDPSLPASYTSELWGVSDGESSRVSVQDGVLVVTSGSEFARGDTTLQTRDVSLEDFKVEYTAFGGGRSRTTSCGNKVLARVGDAEIRLNGFDASGDAYTRCVQSGTIEVKWNDYELGEYQVLHNGQLVGSGSSLGNVLVEFVVPGFDESSSWAATTLELKNPRYKRLFGCDPQENELIVDACFGGPQVLKFSDLEDFNRFCLDFPAKHVVGGVAGSSKRVYYELAQDGNVIVDENEIWEFTYIADNNNNGLTGVGSKCESPVLIEDDLDIEARAELDGVDSFLWVANDESRTITSGTREVLSAGKPAYLCKENDNHDPTGDVFNYPGPDASCYETRVNGELVDGKTIVDGVWSLERSDLTARVRYSTTENGHIRPDEWGVAYDVQLLRPITIVDVDSEAVMVGDEASAIVSISNDGDRFDGLVLVEWST